MHAVAASMARGHGSPAEACAEAAARVDSGSGLAFALVYLLDEQARPVLAGAMGVGDDLGSDAATWPLDAAARAECAVAVPLANGGWPDGAREALVAAVREPGGERPLGYLVAGVDGDDDGRVFVELLAALIAVGIAGAREAEPPKHEFLAMLAHELRNPLAPIRSGLDMLAMDAAGDQRETVDLMTSQVQHLVRLVDDLLDLSRVMGGKVELRREPVELAAVVKRSAAVVQPLLDERGHELAISLPPEPVKLDADPVRLGQVVENLLGNAAKFTEPGGRIDLALQANDGETTLTVSDSGIGIEPELLPRVFDLFAQSTRSLDRSLGGLGVGLTLVRQVVEAHGGEVSACSDGPGRGSTFEVRLPWDPAPEDAGAREPEAADPPARRVLIVDDNGSAVRMLAMLIERLGDHQVTTAEDGAEGLETILAEHPDVVLLDIGLPGLDGFQVARAVRQHPELDDVLLVAMTGYGREEDQQRSAQAGFDEHLVKPIAMEQVQAVLAHDKLAGRRPGSSDRAQAAPEPETPAPAAPETPAPETPAKPVDLRKMRHDLANSADVLQLFERLLEERQDDPEFLRTTAEGLRREVASLIETVEAVRALVRKEE
ncbi:MAG: ATP-binding protein [Pseudomonadota bacterium]